MGAPCTVFAVNTAIVDSKGVKEGTDAVAAALLARDGLGLSHSGADLRDVLVDVQEEQERKGNSLKDYFLHEIVKVARKVKTKGRMFCTFAMLCPGLCKSASVTGIMEEEANPGPVPALLIDRAVD